MVPKGGAGGQEVEQKKEKKHKEHKHKDKEHKKHKEHKKGATRFFPPTAGWLAGLTSPRLCLLQRRSTARRPTREAPASGPSSARALVPDGPRGGLAFRPRAFPSSTAL